MRFVIDNQLPNALAAFLVEHGHEARHVLDDHDEENDDIEIWEKAKTTDTIVVSKDEDFVHLANRRNDNGRLLWVRIGNCRKAHLLTRFSAELDSIIAAFASGIRIVELR